MVQRNNLRFMKTKRGKDKVNKIIQEVTSANRRPIVSTRKKRKLLRNIA